MPFWSNDEIPILQLGSDFYDEVQAAVFPQKQLRYWNDSIDLNINKQHLIDFNPIRNNLVSPLALRYHGHQFQNYNPDLGDGRGFLFAQIKKDNLWYDLGTKGSGQTPYSRAGDGRLTLKGAFRESLATELLQSLGVNTSKTLCFYETGEQLERHDEPSPTRGAVLTRYSQGHIRIGTFQRLAFFNQTENIKKLTSYSLFFYYPEVYKTLDPEDEKILAALFLQNVVDRCAELVAQVMMAGFVHGVLNTDNINVSGELFDYGPYRFLPNYDPSFTAAYFDQQGLYCFGRQPASFLWSLNQLAISLKKAYPELEHEKILENFSIEFNRNIQKHFLKRLNIKTRNNDNDFRLLSYFFQMTSKTQVLFEQAFFDFNSKKALADAAKLNIYKKEGSDFIKAIEQYEIADEKIADHDYFKNDKPCTLIIDEIENLWKPISEKDDWNNYNQKLQSIRQFRGIY